MQQIRKRHLRAEKRMSMLIDALALGSVLAVLCTLLLGRSGIGYKNFIFLTVLHAVLVMAFMVVLDEYKPHVASLYEKGVIFALSSLYSFVILALVDLIFFSPQLMLIHLLYAVAAFVILLVVNTVLDLVRRSPGFRKPRLLVLQTNNADPGRVRRVKYGVSAYYDAWYESIDTSTPDDIERIIREEMPKCDAVCVLDSVSAAAYDRIVNAAVGLDMDLFIVPRLKDIARSNARLDHFDDVLTLHIPAYRLTPVNNFFKRATDIAFALVFIALTAIPMALIALGIKLTSPGPVFYCQERLTRDKKPFKIIKFRTMVPDAEKLSGPVMAQKHDPRITPIGRFLRACRLDELPQFFNILRGDMSVVGPRPERPFFVEQFEREYDTYRFRYAVKAGLTGMSHVYGRYSTYTYDRTCYDLMYITHYSYFLDIKIMLLTSKIMFLKSAAEGEDEFKRQAAKTGR